MKEGIYTMEQQSSTSTYKEIKCLDKGFVRLVDFMGGDESIVQAARVSYGKGTKSVNEDRGLIRYLVRNRHTSSLEFTIFKFHMKLPIFVMRQIVRHRMSSLNEYSGRYSEMKDEFYLPDLEKITTQSNTNKQGGSEEVLPQPETFQAIFDAEQKHAFIDYDQKLKSGMRRELARINLPVSVYTECYWKMDLHNLFHFLKLRLDGHAQYETRVFAEAIAELIKPIVPLAWEAFEDYILYAVTFSKQEMNIIKALITLDEIKTDPEYAAFVNDLSSREITEFLGKLKNDNNFIRNNRKSID